MPTGLFSHFAAVLAGGIAGVLLWASIGDVGWMRYQVRADHLLSMGDIRTSDPDSQPVPDPTERELKEICDPLLRVSGLSYVELAMATHMLNDSGRRRVDHEALARSWQEIGFVRRTRVALFGLSVADVLAIEAVFDAANVDRARNAKRIRDAFAKALQPCAVKGFREAWGR
jgi:hypothetical protein